MAAFNLCTQDGEPVDSCSALDEDEAYEVFSSNWAMDIFYIEEAYDG